MSVDYSKRDKEREALMMFKKLTQNSIKKLKHSDFVPGNMVSFSYIAKNKLKVWDKSPLVLVLWRTKNYTLGLNFHWVPKKVRYILLTYIFNANKKNIANGLPLEISYKKIKPLIIKLKLIYVVRMYINARISARGIIIPQQYMRKAIDLPSENFIGMSAEKAYAVVKKESKLKGRK